MKENKTMKNTTKLNVKEMAPETVVPGAFYSFALCSYKSFMRYT